MTYLIMMMLLQRFQETHPLNYPDHQIRIMFSESAEIDPKLFLRTRPGDDLPLGSARRGVPQEKAAEEQNDILVTAAGGEVSV